MKDNEIYLAEWTEKSNELDERIRRELPSFGIDIADFPSINSTPDKRISIVFAGQYSAGKSTILKALTGIKSIETGIGITTQNAKEYDWNGLLVVDTPGIHTVLRPDHDEISYKAITNSDLLVYVVTQELFDDYIGSNFRDLLFAKDKAGEMVLVVNKMASIGNTRENQIIKLDDLRKVTDPLLPEQLRTVFIDAESYIDSKDEDDEEISTELLERSNFTSLVSTINEFVSEKGMSAQITTGLYKLFDYLQTKIDQYQQSTGDEDIDALEEHLLQERAIVLTSLWRLESAVKPIIACSSAKIRDRGREVANNIYGYKSEDEANQALTEAYNDVDTISTECVEQITGKIQELVSECQIQLDDFYNSDFSKELRYKLENKQDEKNPLVDKLLRSDMLSKGGQTIVNSTLGTNAAATGLRAFSGSNMHKIVLKVGHFFKHSFKPWEAIKWVKGINVAGKVLGVFGVVLSVGMQVKDDADRDKKEIEQREGRERIRAVFNNVANEVENQFTKALSDLIRENYQTKIDSIDTQVTEIRRLKIDKSEVYQHLVMLQDECRELISQIHQEL